MRPLSILFAIFFACAASARAQNDADNDAVMGSPLPAAVSWRAAAPQAAAFPPASAAALRSARDDFRAEPDGQAKADLIGALDELEDGAAKAPPELKPTWIDSHLGRFNDALRALGPRAPAPLEDKALRAAARLNLAAERWQDAREFADKELARNPGDALSLVVRSRAEAGLADFAAADADAERAAALAPQDAGAYAARAAAAYGLGDYPRASQDARRALSLNPGGETALVVLRLAEGRTEEASAARRLNQAEELARKARRAKRERLFLLTLACSLAGGLLVALGVLHVASALKTAPAPTGVEADYLLGKPLGQGGMGIVYEAFDKKLQRRVAVKALRDEYKLDDEAKRAFMEEARLVAELRHPAIIDIHGVVEDDRGLYLIFERLEGRTLDAVLAERKRLPLSEIKSVLKPVCEGLEYAHGRGVVHRDLKPANVMLTGNGVKLLDFGISRHAAAAGAATTQTVTGTPHYMAPEQEYGVVRRENDVFSLGAVLYEMAAGVRPYEGPHQVKLAKLYAPASVRAPGLPSGLDALIDACLEPDPEKRLRSPAEFWRRLSAIA